MMTTASLQELYQQAKSWTIEAGNRLKDSLQEALQVEYKTSAADLVTEKDRETEQFFVDLIQKHYPEHYILGEEGICSAKEYDPLNEVVWIIDPIDGTTNFVHQKQNFSISLAIYIKGEGKIGIIYDPIKNECFHALKGEGAYLNEKKLEMLRTTTVEEALIAINSLWLTPNSLFDHLSLQTLVRQVRGTRSLGSAALEIASVASGRLDGYITLRLAPWDFAAGLVILEEVGAKMSTVDNQPIDVFEKSSIYVAKPSLHEELMTTFLQGTKKSP